MYCSSVAEHTLVQHVHTRPLRSHARRQQRLYRIHQTHAVRRQVSAHIAGDLSLLRV